MRSTTHYNLSRSVASAAHTGALSLLSPLESGMLAGVKVVDKAAAEAALWEEQRSFKKEKKALKKVRPPVLDLACSSMQMSGLKSISHVRAAVSVAVADSSAMMTEGMMVYPVVDPLGVESRWQADA